MTTAVAIFVKTPGTSPVKTRLARDIGRCDAEHFHVLSALCVAEAVSAAAEVRPLRPVWAVAEQGALEHPLWSDPHFSRVGQGTGGLGDRIATVCDGLFAEHSAVVLLGADCPQISADVLVDAVDRLARADGTGRKLALVGRARDGGFHLWGSGSRPDPGLWSRIPWSAPDTADRLVAELADAGYVVEPVPVLSDVDTADDLSTILDEFPADDRLLPAQRDLRGWLRSLLRTCRMRTSDDLAES